MNNSGLEPAKWAQEHGGRLVKLIEGADLAAAVTLRYFCGESLHVEAKADDSPVTVADRTAEAQFRTFITESFPDDSLLGEEWGEIHGSSGYRWVVDPIDGTKSFIAGVPLYSTLVALEFDGEPIAGGIWIPALGEAAVAGRGLGCWYRARSQQEWQRAAVSRKSEMRESIFVTTAIDSYSQVHALAKFEAIQSEAWFTRTWGDGYGYLLVATGRADAMVDPIVNPWDVAAIKPVIEEAGGKFTDWEGVATSKSSNAVGTNGRIHDRILGILR